jgi:hypothetical protein
MAMRFKALMLGSSALAATACAPVDPGFGEAVRYDTAIQTIDPDPQYPEGSAQPGASGVKGQKAHERYRKGETKTLREERSTSSGGGPGGSN